MSVFSTTKTGMKRGFYYVLVFPFAGPFILLKKIVQRIFSILKMLFLDTPQEIRNGLKEARNRFKAKGNEKPDFQTILKLWNISSTEELAQRRREHIFKIGVWTSGLVCLLIGVFLAEKTFQTLTIFALFILTALAGVVTEIWRFDVLNSRQFTFFTDWILQFLFMEEVK